MADVPWAQPCGYHPPVADRPEAELTTHPAAALAARWSSHLAHDRRRSPHTVRAYVATAHRFIQFLGRYRSEAVVAASPTRLTAPDRRSFLARRRAEGLRPASARRDRTC